MEESSGSEGRIVLFSLFTIELAGMGWPDSGDSSNIEKHWESGPLQFKLYVDGLPNSGFPLDYLEYLARSPNCGFGLQKWNGWAGSWNLRNSSGSQNLCQMFNFEKIPGWVVFGWRFCQIQLVLRKSGIWPILVQNQWQAGKFLFFLCLWFLSFPFFLLYLDLFLKTVSGLGSKNLDGLGDHLSSSRSRCC